MKWDRNKWQGKSADQVRFSYKVVSTVMVILTLIFGTLFVMLLVSCKSTENVDCDAYSKISNKEVESGK